MAHSEQEIRDSIKIYLGVYFALLVFTAITVWIAGWKVGAATAVILALAVAITKGTLVAGFFMHLFGEVKIVLATLGFTIFFFLGCMFLPFWNQHDTLSGTQELSKDLIAEQMQDNRTNHASHGNDHESKEEHGSSGGH